VLVSRPTLPQYHVISLQLGLVSQNILACNLKSLLSVLMRCKTCRVMCCPGFGQDRVNFHQTPGRDTAGRADPTPPGQTEPGIPYHVPSCGVPVGGAAQRKLTHGWGACGAGPVRERGSVGCASLCRIFSLSVSLLFLFPSVCCSVKLPLSRPPSFCLFLSILLRTPAGGGAAAWRFCCRWQPKPKH